MSDTKKILEQYKNNEITLESALLELKKQPFEDIGYAKVDFHRKIRQGAAEVIYGEGKTPEQILEHILAGFDIEINDIIPASFECDCSKSRVEKVMISLGKEELQKIIDDGEAIEVNCHFCNTNYKFEVNEIKELYKKCKA